MIQIAREALSLLAIIAAGAVVISAANLVNHSTRDAISPDFSISRGN